MKPEMTVPVDDALGEMLNWAVRYSLGRQTYAVSDTCKYVTPLIPYLNNKTIYCMIRDIQHQDRYGYGGEIDKSNWMILLGTLEQELSDRGYPYVVESIG